MADESADSVVGLELFVVSTVAPFEVPLVRLVPVVVEVLDAVDDLLDLDPVGEFCVPIDESLLDRWPSHN